MLSGRRQPMGSLELTYWRAYLRVKDERAAERSAENLAARFEGLI